MGIIMGGEGDTWGFAPVHTRSVVPEQAPVSYLPLEQVVQPAARPGVNAPPHGPPHSASWCTLVKEFAGGVSTGVGHLWR